MQEATALITLYYIMAMYPFKPSKRKVINL